MSLNIFCASERPFWYISFIWPRNTISALPTHGFQRSPTTGFGTLALAKLARLQPIGSTLAFHDKGTESGALALGSQGPGKKLTIPTVRSLFKTAISNLRFDKVSWEADSSRGVSLKQPTQRLPRGRRIISLDEVDGAKTNKVPKPND